MGIQINGTNDTITTNDGTISIDGGTTITGSLTGTTGVFSGDVGVAGTLTSEDKTNIDSVGLITARTGIKIGPITGVAATHYADGSIRTTGIITASSFVGDFVGDGSGLTGAGPSLANGVDNRVITASSATALNGEANLTFDGSTLAVNGDLSVTNGDISIIDTIVHAGDTNTKIRFPQPDTFSVETSGSERLRINQYGGVGIRTDKTTSYGFCVAGASAALGAGNLTDSGGIILQPTDAFFATGRTYPAILWSGNTNNLERARAGITAVSMNSNDASSIIFMTRHAANGTALTTADERLRISDTGNVNIGTVNNYVGGAPSSGAGKFNVYHTGAGGDDWAMQVRQDSSANGNGIFVRAGNGSSKMALDVRAYDEANKLLQVNGAGHVQTPLQPRASVKIASTTTLSSAKITNWATATFNIGSFWDESNKRFVAPVQGYYLFGGTFRIGAPGKIRIVQFRLQHYNSANQHTATYGSGIGGTQNYDGGSSGYDHPYVVLSQLIQMDHNSYIELHCGEVATEHTSYIQVNDMQSHMWGMLIA